MNWFYLILSILIGGLLALFFFGGLWWTVQRITGSERPYLIAIISFIVRTAVILLGFYLLLRVGWPYLLAALAAFIISRTVLTFKLKPERRPAQTDDNHPR